MLKNLPLVIILIIIASCNKEAEIPSYISIRSTVLNVKPGQGSNSNKVVDSWVVQGNTIQGIYENPAIFPILASGEVTLSILPGIKVNGIASTRSPYHFYTNYTQKVTLVPGQVTEVTPVYEYAAYANFEWLEDFESTGLTMEKSPNSDTSLISVSDPARVFEGTASGLLYIDQNRYFGEARTVNKFTLPKEGANVFLEMNYKCNHAFIVGLYNYFGSASSPTKIEQSQIVEIQPSATWNKIYISLTPTVSQEVNAVAHSVFIGALRKEGESDIEISLDNLKLVD